LVNEQNFWLLDNQFSPQVFTPLEQDLIAISMNYGGVSTDVQSTPNAYNFVDGYLYTHAEEDKDRLNVNPNANSAEMMGKESAWRNTYLPEIQSNLKPMRQVIFKESNLSELSQHFTYLLEIYHRHWELHEQFQFPSIRSYWIDTYQELCDQPYTLQTEILLTGTSNLTEELLTGITDLAKFIQTPGDVRSAIRSHPPEEALAILTTTDDGFAFLKNLLDFIADFGLRTGHGFGSPFSWRTPTWLEEPAQVLAILHPYLDTEIAKFAENASALREKRESFQNEIMETLKNDTDRNQFLTALDLARNNATNRENHNFFIEQMTNGYIRICLTELADRLVNNDTLTTKDDIFFLNLEQVMAVISGVTVPDLTRIIETNRTEHENQAEITPPKRLDASSAKIQENETNISSSKFSLKGVPASAGITTGRARVIDSTDSIPMIDSSDIIVTKNAGPMWIPLLPSIDALVLDYGEIASHAPILMREYQIPCVIQTQNGTNMINNGQTITIDGTNGIIHLEK
tara:strand:+ start:3292 stop:4839 length:1548 start_codon:yes stop_codon:yes gene_type:complete